MNLAFSSAALDPMIGTPLGPEEARSGTWTTLRYAKKKKKPCDIIYPRTP
jgi:hypothetical protein